MGRGLGAFIAGMGTGYLNAQKQARDEERQAKMDQIAIDAAAREKERYDKQKQLEADLAAAGKAAQVIEGVASTDPVTGKTAQYDNPDVFASDARQVRRMNETAAASAADQGIPAPAPITYDNTRNFAAAGGIFSNYSDAQKAAASPENQAAVYAKQAAILRANGKPMEAMQLESAANQQKLVNLQLSEAEAKHADNLFNRKIDERVKKNGGDVMSTVEEVLNETKPQGIAQVKRDVLPDGSTQFSGVKDDGSVVVLQKFAKGDDGSAQALQQLYKFDPSQKITWLHEQAKRADEKADRERTYQLAVKTAETQAAHYKAIEKNAAAQLAFHQGQLKLENAKFDYLKSQDVYGKLTAGDKAVVQSLQKDLDHISAAIAKSMADGNFQPFVKDRDGKETPNPILAQRAVLTQQLKDITDKYQKSDGAGAGAAGKPGADPLGLNKPGAAAPAAPAASAAPAAPAAAPVAKPVVTQPSAAAAAAPAPAAPASSVAQMVAPNAANGVNPSAIDSVMANAAQQIQPIVDQFKQQNAQWVAAVRSGDKAAAQQYFQAKEQTRLAMEKQVTDTFGNNAPNILSNIYAQ